MINTRHSTVLSSTLLLSVPIPAIGTAQTVEQLTPHRVKLEPVEYKGKKAIKISEDGQVPTGGAYAIVKGPEFRNGIEVELAGQPAANAGEGARGFIGVAFRLRDNKFEYIYLRPTNGRAEDQVRRNHSTQYSSFPDFHFTRSRKEARVRITVQGTAARLFVRGATQPAVIVSDLKLGDSSGAVGLWIGPGTEGFFTGLSVKPDPRK